MYGEGISKTGDLLDCAAKAGIVDKAGSWYSYNGDRIGQGRENAKEYLSSHPEAFTEIEATLIAKLKADREEVDMVDEPDEDIVRIDDDGVVIEE